MCLGENIASDHGVLGSHRQDLPSGWLTARQAGYQRLPDVGLRPGIHLG